MKNIKNIGCMLLALAVFSITACKESNLSKLISRRVPISTRANTIVTEAEPVFDVPAPIEQPILEEDPQFNIGGPGPTPGITGPGNSDADGAIIPDPPTIVPFPPPPPPLPLDDEDDGFFDDHPGIALGVCGNGVREGTEQCDDGNKDNLDGCNILCELPHCGNGVVEKDEECDDNNIVSGDGCTRRCDFERCGNLVRDGQEMCDDGNFVAGDGCSPKCMFEICGNGVVDIHTGGVDEMCDDGNIIAGDGCSPKCMPEICGNGVLDPPRETCDDGNTVSGDGCSDCCKLEACGNGIVDAFERCDDGNLIDGDGCSSTCQIELCGNGIITPNEQCDDGNTIDGDGCSSECLITRCGDNIVQFPEACDDGNTFDGDGCSRFCQIEKCGDGVVTPNEECDDGNLHDGDGCSSTCLVESCGDGFRTPNEQCDDGNRIDGDGCSSTCLNEVCGNRIITPNEQCDDGTCIITPDPQCAIGSCTITPGGPCVAGPHNGEPGSDCSTSCLFEFCGDGKLQSPPEECDLGSMMNGMINSSCDANCKKVRCGDGVINGGEECDSGLLNGLDGVCDRNCLLFECGNAIVQPPLEECDFGTSNGTFGVNCSTDCKFFVCGNGVVDSAAGEFCDNGPLNGVNVPANLFFCTPECQANFCGDGFVLGDEECDLGGETSPICLCNPLCRFSTCGDGFVQGTEECDNGSTGPNRNGVFGGSCTATCQAVRPEICNNGIDDDLNGFIDLADPGCGQRFVFVSTGTKTGGAGLGGVPASGAGLVAFDALCQQEANNSTLPPGIYRAWISSTTSSPATQFLRSAVPYVMRTGSDPMVAPISAVKIADNWNDLVDGTISAPINRTVTGAFAPAPFNVWTGTNPDGTLVTMPATTNCTNWTSSSGAAGNGNLGTVGFDLATDFNWSRFITETCDTANRVYCFEQ